MKNRLIINELSENGQKTTVGRGGVDEMGWFGGKPRFLASRYAHGQGGWDGAPGSDSD